ncbi:MAG: helix-turn-helix domain-containing protein [Methanomicrobiales archaeon]|nr:helix-turn-helix domain-containing protein [Methanomicrobiales archaeon]
MDQSKKNITLSVTPEIESRLNQYAAEQQVTPEQVAVDLLTHALHLKKGDALRIVQIEQKGQTGKTDAEGLREIIRRQDQEITWLRDQISRLSTLTPTTHIIKHEYPVYATAIGEHPYTPAVEEKKKTFLEEKEPDGTDSQLPSHVSMEDVHYNIPENAIESEDLIGSGFLAPGRVDERTLRDSIGGVRGDKDYSVSEAAAIAGESETVLMEYISDGFLPAKREGNMYRIRGADLQRYMLSK